VFYVIDPANDRWSIVLITNKANDHYSQECENIDIEDDPFISTLQSLDNDSTMDDILYTRSDHDEGILNNPPFCVNKKKIKLSIELGRGKDELELLCMV
jgi:hypothetical protein